LSFVYVYGKTKVGGRWGPNRLRVLSILSFAEFQLPWRLGGVLLLSSFVAALGGA
jgi:hypothetical protein